MRRKQMSVLPKKGLCSKKSFIILCYRSEPGLNSPYLGLLKGQLNYWFSKKPNGFYKFLEPCNHPLYKAGDSWSEELGISRRVFNAIFDLIGIRYNSKTAFREAKDKFQGKLYASYHDRKTHKMFFIRNAELHQQKEKTLPITNISNPKKISQKTSIPQDKVILKSTNSSLSNIRSSNDTNCLSYGWTIGGKNKDSFTNITASSIDTKIKAQTKKSDDFTEAKKIAEEMKNIWMEEVGECEIKYLSSTLVSRLYDSHSTIFKGSLENWRSYCRKIASSKFLMGEGKGGAFKAWLTWAIKSENYERIEAGEFILNDRKMKEEATILTTEQEAEIEEKAGIELMKKVGMLAFKQWFEEIDIVSYQGDKINLKAPSLFHRDYINRKYRYQILSALEKVLDNKNLHLNYSV